MPPGRRHGEEIRLRRRRRRRGGRAGPGKTVGERELWLGNPARLARTRSDKEVERLHYSAQHYVRLKDRYLEAAAASPQ